MSAPKAPDGLETAGTAVWEGTFAERPDGTRRILRADELPLLAELARLSDDVEAIRAELADEPWTVEGSKGQQVGHPLRAELHRTTTRLESLQKTLGLPDEDGASSSWAGRSLARQRWGA